MALEGSSERILAAETLTFCKRKADPFCRIVELSRKLVAFAGPPTGLSVAAVEVSLGGWNAPRRHKGVNIYQIAVGACIGALLTARWKVWPIPVNTWKPHGESKDYTLAVVRSLWPHIDWEAAGPDAVDAAGIALWAAKRLPERPSWAQ